MTTRWRLKPFDSQQTAALSRSAGVAPLVAHRIHYRLAFTGADGRPLRLDGWKSIDLRHPVRTMTHLPATITDTAGTVVGEARLRFDLRRDLLSFLLGFRFPAGAPDGPRVGGRR